MNIGDTIHIEIVGVESFVSKIIDIDDSKINIHFPKEMSLIPLEPQHKCIVSYIEGDVPYKFEATIEQYQDQDIPYIVLTMPGLMDIKRVQRRAFVRVLIDADIAIYFDDQVDPIVTVTQDISGGGLKAVLKEALPFQTKEMADLYLVLRYGQNRYEYIYTRVELIRNHLEKGVHTISMKFLLDDENERQKIISFCFDVQRKHRKQELS